MTKYEVGDKVVASVEMRTHGKDWVTVDAMPGYVGTVITTNVYGNKHYYTVDFTDAGGMITDAHEIELESVH